MDILKVPSAVAEVARETVHVLVVEDEESIRKLYQSVLKAVDGLAPSGYEAQIHVLDSGAAAIVPGKPKASELITRVSSGDEDQRMPQQADPLSDAQIATLRRWIEQGAVWQSHWAFERPKRPPLPAVRDESWRRHPIDDFVLAKLESQGLRPSARASRERLIRRVSLDLIGLPPTVEEVDAFLADRRPDAYERLVDRLLASPRFGERWARHWLDAARYGDSNGYQRDNRREVWAYRDWVVRAMNDDMPFDQFTVEQIAGDLLPDATMQQKIATGFNRGTLVNIEAGTDPNEERTIAVADRVTTTSTVWLGITMECAQCHSHKYDPFTQKEFYQLYAFFNNTGEEITKSGSSRSFIGPKVELPLSPGKAALRKMRRADVDRLKKALASVSADVKKKQPVWEIAAAAKSTEVGAWETLEILECTAVGGVTFEKQDDGSLLATGENPAKTIYTVTFETPLEGVTALRLDVLTHESFEMKGPGRGDRPNFILSEFRAEAAPLSDPSKKQTVEFKSAWADFSQNRWPVANAIDGDRKTGWAINPQFSKDHYAVFVTQEKTGSAGGTRWTLTLDQQYGAQRTIGRFRLSATTGNPGESQLPDDIRKILARKADKRPAKQRQQLKAHFLSTFPKVKKAQDRLKKAEASLAAVKPDSSLVMYELDKPRMTRVFERGDFLKPGETVQPETPEALHAFPEGAPRNRLGLARWLVDQRNPLVARVTVNRFWSEIFGRGLVATPEDFGTQGARPTHPQLLDFLATEFVRQGWSMKRLIRGIVTSATYQQSARVTPEQLRRDPENALYTRGPRFRMDAEMIRDNALRIGGLLSDTLGGPPVFPYQPPGVWNHIGVTSNNWTTSQDDGQYRRGLYVYLRRAVPYPSFVNFDAPSREQCTVKRSRSNTPLQALTLMNDPVYVEAAGALAGRILRDRPGASPRDRVTYAFRLALARKPTNEEHQVLLDCHQQELAWHRKNPGAAAKLVSKWSRQFQGDPAEFAAWLHVATVLLNLDETITKG